MQESNLDNDSQGYNQQRFKFQKSEDMTSSQVSYNHQNVKKYAAPQNNPSLNNNFDHYEYVEENYQSERIINSRNDVEDMSLSINRSVNDMINSNTQRHYNSIQPMHSTINPRLKLYNMSDYSMNVENKQIEEESGNQLMFNISQRDKNISLSIPQQNPKQKSIQATNMFEDYFEETNNDQFKGDFPIPLSKGNSQNKSRPSIFQTEQKISRQSVKRQSENFYNALSKITSNEKGGVNVMDSQSLYQSQSESIGMQALRKSVVQNQKETLDLLKSTKFNIQSIKKKEEQMREHLATRIQQFQKFFRSIKHLSSEYKFRMMTPEQKELIHDLSFHQSRKKYLLMGLEGKRACQKFLQKVQLKLSKSIPVFNPLHFAIISLELIVFAILMMQLFILPLSDSFRVNLFDKGYIRQLFFTAPTFILTIAIIIKFNTAYFKDNVLITDRKKIFSQFIHRDFLIELISLFAIIINQVTEESYVYFFFIIRLNLIGSSLQKIDQRFSLTQRSPHFFQVIKLIFLAFILAHINGCIFNYVARDLKVSWLTEKKIKDDEWQIRYLNSVYFSFITMVTVGYGDITPISIEEKLFVICMTVYSCGAFGYIVSSIGNIFTDLAQKQAIYKRQLSDIVHYMRNRNIDQEIQVQVFQYLQYLEQMDDYNHQKGEQIVQKLSPQLQTLIKKDFYYPFLSKTNIFKLNFSEQILINATLKMKELTFGPGQVIFENNDCDNRIYYILKGEVQLSRFKIKLSVKDEIDNCFGITEFFSGESRSYSAKSKTVTQIVYLELNEFKQILKEDTEEYERFCSLREQIIQTKLVADQSCFFCRKYYHTYEQCPFYTIKHQKIVVIEKSKVSIPQIRKEFDRGKREKQKCLQDIHDIRIHLKAVRLNYINNSIIDKATMIQLIEQTLFDERDIDFYRNYEAFELRLKDDGSNHYAHLIAHDRVAEEFFNVDDEINENNTELENPQPKVTARYNTIQGQANQPMHQSSQNEDFMQKVPSITSLVLNHYFQKKNSFTSQITQNLNGNNQTNQTSVSHNNSIASVYQNDKYSLFKQGSMINNSKSNNQSNSAKRLSEQKSINSIITQSKIPDELMRSTLQQIMKSSIRNDVDEMEAKSIVKKSGFFGIEYLDAMKEYTRYYPKFNFSYVLSQNAKFNIKRSKALFKKKKRSQCRQGSPFTPQNYVKASPYDKDRFSVSRQQLDSISRQYNHDQKTDQQLNSPSQIYSNLSQIQQNINAKKRLSNVNDEGGSFSSYLNKNSSPKRSIFKSGNEQSFVQKEDDFSFYQ